MSNSMLFQRDWNTYQKKAFIGQTGSQPGSFNIRGIVNTPGSGTKPQPGYPVFYNASTDRFEVPRTAAQVQRICGVIVYNLDDIPDASQEIIYENDDAAEICIRGSVWVKSGAALEPTAAVTWDTDDNDWIAASTPTVAVHTPLTQNTVNAINTGLTDLRTKVNAAIASLGYTRLGNLSARAVKSGELFEIYQSGGIII